MVLGGSLPALKCGIHRSSAKIIRCMGPGIKGGKDTRVAAFITSRGCKSPLFRRKSGAGSMNCVGPRIMNPGRKCQPTGTTFELLAQADEPGGLQRVLTRQALPCYLGCAVTV